LGVLARDVTLDATSDFNLLVAAVDETGVAAVDETGIAAVDENGVAAVDENGVTEVDWAGLKTSSASGEVCRRL
jgi:hypothetical protein